MTSIKLCIITITLSTVYIFSTCIITSILFKSKSEGSIIWLDGKPIGSKLIGQNFRNNIYFYGRPSRNNHDTTLSGCSNFPYFSTDLVKNIKNNYTTFLNKHNNENIDLNLISESGSGLDPHITLAGAKSQIKRVSKYTSIPIEKLDEIVKKNAKPRILGLFGEKIVNVLELNIAVYKEINRK